MKEYYCRHDDSSLSGTSTATDSQTTPSPPAAKKPRSLPGKSTNNELLVALVIKNVHACMCMYSGSNLCQSVQQGGAI